MKTLLSTTYCGPVQWYQKLYRSEEVFMERQETFQKQTYRNRCVIATTNGLQTLTVPVERSSSNLIKDIRISNHGNWRHQHWFALMSAYNESPFFDYYQDDFRPFYERQYDFLYDFNMEICHKVCELIDIQPNIKETSFYRSVGVRPLPPPSPCRGSLTSNPSSLISHLSSKIGSSPHSTNLSTRQLVNSSTEIIDFRSAINPKHPADDADFVPRRYYQVYERKHGFQPNLSILDLLFNMGPESVFWL
ncbi:MAG: WbqC family protein [Prevotella sp.]|nr:WbqC family protein [Prevotella sp.]MBR2034420.1 WbqC family protein [Prevotella sp.]